MSGVRPTTSPQWCLSSSLLSCWPLSSTCSASSLRNRSWTMQPIRWSSRSSCPAVLTARPTRSLTFCVQRSKGQRTLPIPLMPHISRPHRLECSRQSSWGLLSISPLRAKQSWAASGIWIWSTSQWWPAAPASANTIGSEVAYEAFYAVAATTTPQ